ncbi:preprotein translocase subunit SecG [Aquabacterium sp. A7-Y]|uniref:preprotein translocase subunit SecG n=1 Tax=Aquabacterium sp. A7-Y TaxID=1349605 RepID=UPI00223CD68A|nr:preprotein translocase subunit SecG [Aquabacterium sp. A7-Y]MCW7538153.1 preprotein translocase subunit SecG [Aquabacterium sp. A7-Y]
MQFLTTFILVVQLLSALTMIGLVLVQHGKGADMGASFGSGASGSLFGATGSANFLSRTTAVCATLFFVCTLGLAYLSNARPTTEAETVLDRAVPIAPAASGAGASQIPGAAPAVTPGVAPAASEAAPAASAATAPASGAAEIPAK